MIDVLGWCVSLLTMAIIIFGLYPNFIPSKLSKNIHIVYQILSRPLWSVSLGFIIYSLFTKQKCKYNTRFVF
jgi:hypothetical protein